jgi:hypothetical protein
VIGETSYSRRSPEEKLAEIVVADALDLMNAIVRRVEKMSADVPFQGPVLVTSAV